MTEGQGGALWSGSGRLLWAAATAGLVGTMALLMPGPLVGQGGCNTIDGPRVEELRQHHRESAEFRDSVEAILHREEALDSVGEIRVTTDPDEMQTNVAFVDFDPPQSAVYRIRGLLAEHFAGKPPEERNLRLDLEAPVVTIEGDRVETCSPVATNDDHVRQLLQEVAHRYRDMTMGVIPGDSARSVFWVFVDWRGDVNRVRVQESSGDEWLDEALASVAREMEFEPATIEGTPMGVWVTRELTIRQR